MTEFALALPLLTVVLALLWFVGWSHMRKQRVVVANRHVAWRALADDLAGSGQRDAPMLDDREVDDQLLNGAPISVSQDLTSGYWTDRTRWVEAAGDFSDAAATFARETLIDRWPADVLCSLRADYPPPLAIGRDMGNDISFRHGRAGPEWLRGQAAEDVVLRQLYYQDLDEALRSIDDPGRSLADRIRGLYLWSW